VTPDSRPLDLLLYGATGFVGRLTAEYLARSAPDGVRIGLAGRSRERVEEVRGALGPRAADWPIYVADSSDTGSLGAIARSTRVLVTTVGPYRKHGLGVVEACAEAGTHYADLTGEVLFMHEVIERFDARARETGARIVHTCGFDSIPSDLGVLLLHEAAQADGAGPLEEATLVVRGMKGGPSGGTIASMKGMIDDARADPRLRKVLGDPYALSPDRGAEPDLGPQRELMGVEHDDDLGVWVAPFVMASINTRVVRRSNALQDFAYGRGLRYREVMSTGSGPLGRAKAAAVAAGTGALAAGLAFGPARTVLDRVLPAPGEGPSEEARRSGYFKIDVHGRTATGRRYVCRVAAQGDPGYQATSVMLGESALCLALDAARLPDRAGVPDPRDGHGRGARRAPAGAGPDARGAARRLIAGQGRPSRPAGRLPSWTACPPPPARAA
jgi:short subunit dehydrogenase-like uncharacterized protein